MSATQPPAAPRSLATDAFLVVDRAGRCTHASGGARALLGGSAPLVGRPLAELLPADSALPGALREAIATQVERSGVAHGLAEARELTCRILPSPEGAVVLLEAERPAAEPLHRVRYLHAVLETVPECIKVLTADGVVLDMNSAGLAMLEAPGVEAVLGHPAEEFIAPAGRDAFERLHAAVMSGASTQAEMEIVTLSGRERRVEMHGTPLRAAGGAISAALFVTHDVTDRHAQAERLRGSELRFRALAASAPIGIFLGAADGRQTYANPRYASIWHMPPEESAGFGWMRRVHPDDRRALLVDGTASLEAGAEFTIEHRIVLDDGTVRWVRTHVVPLGAEGGSSTTYIGTIDDITERREAADAVARALTVADVQRALLEAVLEALPAGVIFADPGGRIVRATRQARLLWGGNVTADGTADYTRYPSRLRGTSRVLPEEERALTRALRGESTAPREMEIDRLDGGTATVLTAAAPVRDAEGHIIGGVVALTDISERVRLEAELRQAQKMEAVGQLAGGIAHDFNNLLTVINGNLEFVRHDLAPDHPSQRDLAEVAEAAERARTLVRQLLAFSRKQVVQPRDLDLNDVVRGAESLLRRVLGEEIALTTTLAPAPAIVRADRGQMEQVLLNLAVNARDAMLTSVHGHPGKGGTLTIGTEAVTLAPDEARAWAPLGTGRYVRLTVSDTGHGMDETTRAHIFEPFFTTKAVGAGTGLGLATVYGIVAQAGGAIHVDSAPGEGATFSILLPEAAGAVDRAAPGAGASPPPGRGTVLIVEDETAVRITTRRVLERQGYGVVEARHGADALLVWREHQARVVACVTDLRMPEMGGRELGAMLRADRPSLPMVYVSGYGDAAPTTAGPHEAFLGKPFTAETLLAALQAAMGAPGARRG